MKLNKLIFSFSVFFILTWISSANYSIYYGANKNYAIKTFTSSDMMIIQPYNFNLYKNYTWKKVCYLSVWEFAGTASWITNLWLDEAVVWTNPNWNSIIMDMWNLKWQNYLVWEEIKLKNMWCNWLFLDTISNDSQKSGAIEIVKKMRANWKDSYIVPNNAHNIKNDINDLVDGYMFEDLWSFWTKVWSADAIWYEQLSSEYAKLVAGWKKVYALSYNDPFVNTNKIKWWNQVLALANKYNFELVFWNSDLSKIFAYKSGNKLVQFK